jgi:hypothetical protein
MKLRQLCRNAENIAMQLVNVKLLMRRLPVLWGVLYCVRQGRFSGIRKSVVERKILLLQVDNLLLLGINNCSSLRTPLLRRF